MTHDNDNDIQSSLTTNHIYTNYIDVTNFSLLAAVRRVRSFILDRYIFNTIDRASSSLYNAKLMMILSLSTVNYKDNKIITKSKSPLWNNQQQ